MVAAAVPPSDIEPDVCIRGFNFIFEVEFEEMAAFVSILRTDLHR